MSNFLLGLGRALRAGGSLAGQWRQEDLAQDRENRAAEMQTLQMALMQRDQDLQEQQFDLNKRTLDGQQEDRARGFAKDLLAEAGPNGNLDAGAVEAINAGGFGHRVRPVVTQDPVTFSPVEGGQASVIPTAGESIKLNEQQVVERARRALEDPRFASLPPERREIIRQQAGLNGQAPPTWDEQKRELDYQHKLRMEELDAANQWRYDSPYGLKGGAAGGAHAGAAAEYEGERNQRIRDALKDLSGRADYMHVGLASLGSYIPGTPQRDFAEDLNFLVSNIGFKELQEMRAASKTGGALGQVSDTENKLLQSALGALSQAQSPQNFRKNLALVEASLNRWENAKMQIGGAESYGGNQMQPAPSHGGPQAAPSAPDPRDPLGIRRR